MLITYSSGKKNKIHISTDGEYRFTVDADFWFSLGIYQNTEMSLEAFSALEESVYVRRAFNKGMDYLARRAHSKAELIQKISKTIDKKYAIIAAEQLEQRGYLDDNAFAEQYYDYLKRTKHYGQQRIAMELARKGIAREISQALFEQDVSDPCEEILSLLQGKFAAKLSDEAAKRRTVAALVRMGYRYSDINSALARVETQEYFE